MLKQTKRPQNKTSLSDCETIAEQSINKAKSEFVTLASHQLRTPISAIKWFTEMLLQGDAGTLSTDQREYIKQIHISNTRLTAIVDDLLLASTLESRGIAVRPELTSLPALCQRVLADQLHIQKENKKLKIVQQYGKGLDAIPLDPSLTKIILRNLFSNAIKYTPAGGTIRIRLSTILKKLNPKSKGSIQLQVADTGYGIPKKEQQNMFVKLYRASNIRDKDTDGTGLGLFIIKELLEQVGGSVTFSTMQNVGSTFTVLLPIEGMRRNHTNLRGSNA